MQKVDAGAHAVTVDVGAGRMQTLQAGDSVKDQYVERLSISVASEDPVKRAVE